MFLTSVLHRARFAAISTSSWAKRAITPLQPNSDARIQVLVRYSVLFIRDAPVAWRISRRNEPSVYRSILFADERLRSRLTLFREVLLPSLLNQTMPFEQGKREVLIFVAEGLPSQHLEALTKTAAGYGWLRIIPVLATAATLPPVEPDRSLFASVRLDDDDAISKDYLERLSGYVRAEYAGHAITFPRGFCAIADEGLNLTDFWETVTPNHSAGLAYIVGPATKYRSVFELGAHNKVHEKAPLIIDRRSPAYLRTIHSGQDSSPKPNTSRRTIPREAVEPFVGLASSR